MSIQPNLSPLKFPPFLPKPPNYNNPLIIIISPNLFPIQLASASKYMINPGHQPQRFQVYIELQNGKGFRLKGSDYVYRFDRLLGWFDQYGNYYNCDGKPDIPPVNGQLSDDQLDGVDADDLDDQDEQYDHKGNEFDELYGGKGDKHFDQKVEKKPTHDKFFDKIDQPEKTQKKPIHQQAPPSTITNQPTTTTTKSFTINYRNMPYNISQQQILRVYSGLLSDPSGLIQVNIQRNPEKKNLPTGDGDFIMKDQKSMKEMLKHNANQVTGRKVFLSGPRGTGSYGDRGDRGTGGYGDRGDRGTGGYGDRGDRGTGGYGDRGDRGTGGYGDRGDRGGYGNRGDKGGYNNNNYHQNKDQSSNQTPLGSTTTPQINLGGSTTSQTHLGGNPTGPPKTHAPPAVFTPIIITLPISVNKATFMRFMQSIGLQFMFDFKGLQAMEADAGYRMELKDGGMDKLKEKIGGLAEGAKVDIDRNKKK